MSGQRDVFYNPAPIYDMPGFSIANLPRSYSASVLLLEAVAVDPTTSDLFAPGSGEGFGVAVETSGITVDVSILDESDNVVVKKLAVKHGTSFYVSWFDQRIDVRGKQYKVLVDNFSDTGTVTVKYNPQ
jgi:hypothetical protein